MAKKNWSLVKFLFLSVLSQNTLHASTGLKGQDIFYKASKEFGDLVVKTTDEIVYDLGVIPWRGPWLQDKNTDIFKVLQKYDSVNRFIWNDSTLAYREEKDFFSDNKLIKESDDVGSCLGWALASVLEKAPAAGQKKFLGRVQWSSIELKMLLVKKYQIVENLRYYGQKNMGPSNIVEDGNYPAHWDIAPDQMHLLVQKFLGNKRPLFMDRDPTNKVYTVPVYKVKSKITRKIPAKFKDDYENVIDILSTHRGIDVDPELTPLYVRSKFYYTKEWEYEDSSTNRPGTLSPRAERGPEYENPDRFDVIYHYILFASPTGNDNEFKVHYGGYIGTRSRIVHPDYFIALPDDIRKIRFQSINKEITPKRVNRILKYAD